MIANLFNVPVDDKTLQEWSFAHMAHHRDIVKTFYDRYNIVLPEYLLDPFDPTQPSNWEWTHQVMHKQMNTMLDITGNNLLGVTWEDENKRAAWILLNANEHRLAGDILGIG